MPDETIAIARVPLARDLRRIVALPILLILLAGAAADGALLIGGAAALGLAATAGVLALAALVLVAVPLSLRLEIEVGGLWIRSLAGSRHFQLVRGPVTRIALTGAAAGSLRSRRPILGWSNWGATLRGNEAVHLLRMARTETVILIPTDRGRLAVAPATERELVDALAEAARVQQRLEQVSSRGTSFDEAAEVHALASTPAPAPPEPEAPPFLTGIERARLEARLAAAREAALIAAEAERAAQLAASDATSAAETIRVRAAPPGPELEEEVPLSAPSPARERVRATWRRPAWATDARLRVLVTIAWAAVPLVASLATWAAMPAVETVATEHLNRLALAFAGPAGALGVVLARSWWPRLTGLVTVSAVATLVLIARTALP